MPPNLRITHISLLFLLMALSGTLVSPAHLIRTHTSYLPRELCGWCQGAPERAGVALTPSAQVSPTNTLEKINLTPTATRLIRSLKPTFTATPLARDTATPVKPKPIPLDMQGGNSDWIMLIGFLIVAIIVIPILLKRKEWRGS